MSSRCDVFPEVRRHEARQVCWIAGRDDHVDIQTERLSGHDDVHVEGRIGRRRLSGLSRPCPEFRSQTKCWCREWEILKACPKSVECAELSPGTAPEQFSAAFKVCDFGNDHAPSHCLEVIDPLPTSDGMRWVARVDEYAERCRIKDDGCTHDLCCFSAEADHSPLKRLFL